MLMAGVAPEELRMCLRQNLLATATVPMPNAVLGRGSALLWCSAALLGSPGISWCIPQAEIKQVQSLGEKTSNFCTGRTVRVCVWCDGMGNLGKRRGKHFSDGG